MRPPVSRARLARTAAAAVLALTLLPAAGSAQEGSGGKNVVIVVNETDGRTAERSGALLGHAGGPSAVPENLAYGKSSCTDCRTVAVAVQAVLVPGYPQIASPRNSAVATNVDCTRCATMSYAWQYVVSTHGGVTLTPDGQQRFAELRGRIADAAASGLPFPELEARLDALAEEVRMLIDEEVRRTGPFEGRTGRSVKTASPRC